MAKVTLYQDIDGCLNAGYNARVWRQEGDEVQAGYQRAWVHPEHDDFGNRLGPGFVKYRMEWNERLIEALNSMSIHLVWTTTWRADALKVGRAMGLVPEYESVLHPLSGQTTFPSIEWKFEAILDEQTRHPSLFIAVDDEWDSVPRYRAALENLGGLVISPNPVFGVSPEDVESMREYIMRHS